MTYIAILQPRVAMYLVAMRPILATLIILLSTITISADTLRVAVYDSPPFGYSNGAGNADGLMVDLWEEIANDLNMDYTYEMTDMSGLMSGLSEGKYDLALGAISITPSRERLVDFTHAVNPSGTGMAIARDALTYSFWDKWAPVFTSLLGLIATLLIMLLIAAVIVYLIERKYAKQDDSDRNIDSIADGLWWSAVTMTTVGYGDKVPRSKSGKVLGIIWIFFSIVFFSLFTANASAKLSNPVKHDELSSLSDIQDKRVIAVAKSSGEEYLKREHIDYTTRSTIDDAIRAVIDGKADVIVSNVPVLKYYNKMIVNDQLLISKQLLLRNNMGIALPDNSPLKEELDRVLLQKISEENWQNAVYQYLGD